MTWTFPLPKAAAGAPGTWTPDQGIDITAPGHTPLYAVGAGTIVQRGIGGFGPDAPVLQLADGSGYVYYGHAGPAGPPVGTRLKAGDVIGEVGAGIVGQSTGPHLEIGLSNATGTPLGTQTAAAVKSLLSGAQTTRAAGGGGALSFLDPTGGPLDPGGGPLDPTSSNFAGGIPAAIAAIPGQLFDQVKGSAMKAFLTVMLVLGGLALLGFGATRSLSGASS